MEFSDFIIRLRTLLEATMKARLTATMILTAAALAGVWEFVGHRFLMGVPMSFRHWIDGAVATALTIIVATVAVHTILLQHKKLAELARIRDYLFRMESHYLRIPAASYDDPLSYFETQAARNKLLEAQSHLASSSPQSRAHALMELAVLASVPLAGREKELIFFGRAASHIAASLYLEKAPEIRAQALAAVRQLCTTALEAGEGHAESLAAELAHANRIAWEFVQQAIGSRARQTGRGAGAEEDIRKGLEVLGCSDVQVAALLDAIIASEIPITSVPETNTSQKLESLIQLVNILKDCREGLADALKRLRVPSDIPGATEGLRTWKRSHPLSLSGCFLGFADLQGTHLPGVDLTGACLVGARLTRADLRRADLQNASLRYSQMDGADLTCAKLTFANLRDSGLSTAILVGADLTWAQLSGAHMVGSKLDSAMLFLAQMAADDGKTGLADLTRANWWDARFNDPLRGEEDRKLRAWLKSRFPPPPDKQHVLIHE